MKNNNQHKHSENNSAKPRSISMITQGIAASDGDKVQLTRVIGNEEIMELDPFLMLDRFSTSEPQDYIGGFPPHPHRGFETITYLLHGKMQHEDNKGNKGVIQSGGAQWMTAGKGIIHSEMPEQEQGLLDGFQLWINLPAKHKMTEPSYQDIEAETIPTEDRSGVFIKVIAGKTSQGTQGIVDNQFIKPNIFDITLSKEQNQAEVLFNEPIANEDNCFVMVIEGTIYIGEKQINKNQLAILSEGNFIEIKAKGNQARFLMVSATPINEPIARGGPFVMNNDQEIKQAFADYKNGQF